MSFIEAFGYFCLLSLCCLVILCLISFVTGTGSSIQSVCMDGDTLVMRCNDTVLRWKFGQDRPSITGPGAGKVSFTKYGNTADISMGSWNQKQTYNGYQFK